MRDAEYKLLTSVYDVLIINESCYRPSGGKFQFSRKRNGKFMNAVL